MEMEFSKLEKLVGAFIVGVILLLMAILIMIGRGKDWFETYKTYYTNFNESYNLQENAEVKLFKANIGKVTDITLEEDRVLVRLEILERYASRMRQDAIAIVESPTLIGSEYISIIPGSADSPRIPEGGEIQSREKRSLTDILAEFEVEKTAKMVIGSVQDFSELTMYLNRPEGPLKNSLNNIQLASEHLVRITGDLDDGKGILGALIKSEALLDQIETSMTQVVDILSYIEQAAAHIEQAAAQTPHAMELVEEGLNIYRESGVSLNQRMNEAQLLFEQISAAMADLQIILGNIRIGSNEIPKISTTFRDGIKEIREGVDQVNRVVDAMQQNVFIRSNLSQESPPEGIDAGARP